MYDGANVPEALGRTAYRIISGGPHQRAHTPPLPPSKSRPRDRRARRWKYWFVNRRPVEAPTPPRRLFPVRAPGLIGLSERVALAGGELVPRSAPGTVTTSCARPCPPARVTRDPRAAGRRRRARALGPSDSCSSGAEAIEVVGEADGRPRGARGSRCPPTRRRVMDLRMPRLDGIGATRLLRGQPSPPAVLVLTTFHADGLVLRALRAGAADSCSRTRRRPRSCGRSGWSTAVTGCSPPSTAADRAGRWRRGRSPTPKGRPVTTRRAQPSRARGRSGGRPRAGERRDRRRTAHERRHRQGARLAAADQARGREPGPDRAADARRRRGLTGSAVRVSVVDAEDHRAAGVPRRGP